ncbi:hypothetical protein [Hathewaya limosa]|uniref:Uncharacterized protein n=1 Tax=Hathewaya limosa TaxID=1536 RepID=A0ABU0JPC8_HATLI|nr:hypothetical protein [Hathewaya limosa]MDQ0478941.1 hypothetical protein [Hathewaya limosa]
MSKQKKELPLNEFSHFHAFLEKQRDSLNSVNGYKSRDLQVSTKVNKK